MTKLCISKRLEDFVFVLAEKPRTRLELMNIGFGGGTIKKLEEQLKKWGLVTEFIDAKNKRAYLRLTEKGKKFVEMLKEIYSFLES